MKKIFAIALSAMLLALCFAVSAGAAEYVYYENDFSDAATLSDFTIMKGEWDCVDGQLMLVGFGECDMDDQGWLLFSKDEGIMNLTDYILEVDMMNIQTQAGPLVRCDLDNCVPENNSGFCGYQTFMSFTGTKGAIGYGKLDGNWGGNLLVSEDVLTPGSNIHLKSTLSGTTINYVITSVEDGTELWVGEVENDLYAYGTFGFRSCIMKDGITNLGMLGYDNLKVTAIGDVGDHLAAGKALKDYTPKVKGTAIKPEMTNPVEVVVPEVVDVDASKLDGSKTEYVFYENDFSDPATLADFTTYRGNWAIRDGALYYDSLRTGYEAAGNFALILYSANHDANLLSDYTVELDIMNSQSAAGILSRCDLSKASSKDSSAFYGYISFVSNNGTLAAVGKGNYEGGWAGNIKVSEALLTPGNNYHLVVTHDEDYITYNIYDLGSDVPIWTYEGEVTDWDEGTFGLRSVSTKDALTNLGTVAFDNLKVTVHGEQAVLLNAGYHPNAKIKGELKMEAPAVTTPAATEKVDAPIDETVDAGAEVTVDATAEVTVDATADVTVDATAEVTGDVPATTEAPEATDAPETTAAPVVDDPEATDAPVVTTAPATTAPAEGGAPVALIIGIVAAVVVIAAIVAVVLKKKKN